MYEIVGSDGMNQPRYHLGTKVSIIIYKCEGGWSPISSAANMVAENFLDKVIAAVGDLSRSTGDNIGVPAGGGASLCSYVRRFLRKLEGFCVFTPPLLS